MKGEKTYQKALKIANEDSCDLTIVFDLLTKSYNLGNYNAAYALGTWYLFGKYVKKNYTTAVHYLDYASAGNANACSDLAICYEKGKGAKKDMHKAFTLYLKAFLLGDKSASYEIGRHYYYGLSVSKDIEVAKIWLNYSDNKGNL